MSRPDTFLKEFDLQLEAVKKMNSDGSSPLNDDYQEILKLHEMLEEHEIPHDMFRHFDGWVVKYPVTTEAVCSCVQHCFSYGGFFDKIEIMGLLTPEEEENDSVLGWLTAEDVFGRIKAHWEANKL